MKKLLFFVALISLTVVAGAQVSSNALGARFYGGDTFSGAELSYQKGLNDRNRLELDASFGFRHDFTRLALVGIYHWNWNIAGGFNWYVGPGATVAYDNFEGNTYVNVGVGGQIGIEYKFRDLPVLVSLDSRPMWDFLGDVNGLGWGAALGIRFTW
ncbi:MAG: hypothetical protein MUE37_12555 [Bacteroidales bacterium]|jgi:hypothetical protein|nr:hypothetical protein [Bacteroidales bacterium]